MRNAPTNAIFWNHTDRLRRDCDNRSSA